MLATGHHPGRRRRLDFEDLRLPLASMAPGQLRLNRVTRKRSLDEDLLSICGGDSFSAVRKSFDDKLEDLADAMP